jgi:hypothetical protein
MKKFRTPNREEGGILIAILSIILGGYVRLYPASISGFPINDGGLFVIMIEAIKADGLRLPAFFQYNGLNIPFAYPPFAFYFGAITSILLHVNPIDIVRWIPGIISALTIPSFYFLVRPILNSSYRAGLATMAFSFTPRTFTWSVMGGGLTRSFGLLFLLLSLGFIYRLFRDHDRKYLLGSILFSSLVVLSHPEAMIHTMVFALLFWIFVGRDKPGLINASLVGLGTIVATCIWWLLALIQLGPGPFMAAANTGAQSTLSFLYPFILTLTEETFLTFIAILGFIGLFVCLVKKEYLLPILYLAPFFVDPRSASTYAMVPLTMMAGLTLSEVILPGIIEGFKKPTTEYNPFQSSLIVAFLIFTISYMILGNLYFGSQLKDSTLSEPDRVAINWIKANTPPESRFLILTGEREIFCDSAQEWFPVLSNRIGITTIQGKEWLPNHIYTESLALQDNVQSCMDGQSPLNCLAKYPLQYDYIYIKRQGFITNYCHSIAPVSQGDNLIMALEENSAYRSAYQTSAVAIFSIYH